MRIFFGFLGIFLDFVASRYMENDRCTAILVGAKASVTGAPMTTHSNDCGNCDIRLIKVPQMKHSPGEVRNITLVKQEYPRYVGSARGPSYAQSSLERGYYNWTNSPTIGAIPQVNETFAYFEGVYGIMNEHQLSMGESTCGAKLWTKPISQGGHALFDITELGRIALERTKTAREAILLMGNLAETFGYYGASWDDDDDAYEEAGEALTITDTKEAWMFHILPDDTGKSAVWVAQRVPDNHISAIANQFVIHHVDLDDTENFLGSKNMFEVAKRNGFWDGTTVFDFTVAFALEHHDPEQYGYTRRVWRVFQLANPNVTLSPFTDDYSKSYPFSIETGLLKPEDLMRIQRDHYEGTAFDLTQGPSAGPYGDPDRFRVGPDAAGGQFERSIGIYRATYTFVTVPHPTNNHQAFFWFGPYAPHATMYVPVYTQVSDVPKGLSHGTLRKFDPSYNFWAGAVVGNYAGRFYKFTHPFVVKAQNAFESVAIAAQTNVQNQAETLFTSKGPKAMVDYLTNATTYWSNTARDTLQTLFTTLVTQCHDGYVMSDFEKEEMSVQVMGYPKWWLQSVGYYYNSSIHQDDFQLSASLLFFFIVTILFSIALGFFFGRRSTPQRGYVHLQ